MYIIDDPTDYLWLQESTPNYLLIVNLVVVNSKYDILCYKRISQFVWYKIRLKNTIDTLITIIWKPNLIFQYEKRF